MHGYRIESVLDRGSSGVTCFARDLMKQSFAILILTIMQYISEILTA